MISEESDSTPNPYQAPASSASHLPNLHRGMVGHAPVVGTLMAIQGVLNCLAGGIIGIYVILLPSLLVQLGQGAPGPVVAPGTPGMMLLVVGGTILAAVKFGLGGILIYSGISVARYQRRMLAIVALAGGMVTLFTCYCFPTSLALGIYGLIFLLNQPVTSAFEMRKQGKSVQEIQKTFLILP